MDQPVQPEPETPHDATSDGPVSEPVRGAVPDGAAPESLRHAAPEGRVSETRDAAPDPAAPEPTDVALAPEAPEPEPVAQIPTSVWAAPPPDPTQWSPQPFAFQEPKPPPPTCDPLAVALANASFLGAGYLMLRRRVFAILSLVVTFALLVTVVNVRSIWVEIAIVAWWAAMVAHGWFLARPGEPIKKQRLVAAALTVPVILAVGVLRFDAARVENRIDEAKGTGDCTAAMAAVDRLWAVHTVANAPLTARADVTQRTCAQLLTAGGRLSTALREGDTEELKRGFDALKVPAGHEKLADSTRDAFLGTLPSDNPCHTSAVTNWLKKNTDREDAVDRVLPKALVECGEAKMKSQDHQDALAEFKQFLADYPGHELAPKAQEGEKQATLAIELANVRTLLSSNRYCDAPAQYSGAPAYGKGVNKSIVLGNDEYSARLGDWLAKDASEAGLIVCAGKTEMGAPVNTCPYESKIGSGIPVNVTFKKIAIPVRAFELRTGKQVADTRVEIGGESCPPILQYTTYAAADLGPPSEVHVKASDADVRNGFAPVITP